MSVGLGLDQFLCIFLGLAFYMFSYLTRCLHGAIGRATDRRDDRTV